MNKITIITPTKSTTIQNIGGLTSLNTNSTNNGPVILEATASTGVYAEVNNGTISLQYGYTAAKINDAWQTNFNQLVQDVGTSGKGFYISKINGIQGTRDPDRNPPRADGDFAIVGGNTTDVVHNGNYDNPGLYIDDFGRPDVDCQEYATLNTLLVRLDEYLDNVKTQIIGKPLNTPDNKRAVVYGVHTQYKALVELWNNTVQLSAVRTNVSYQNKHIFIQVSITNTTNQDLEEFKLPLRVMFSQPRVNSKLYIKYVRGNAYLSSSSTVIDISNNVCSLQTFPAGSTLTINYQYEVSTTLNNEAYLTKYVLDSTIREARVQVIPGINTTAPPHHSSFEQYYEYPELDGKSRVSTGDVHITPKGSYDESEAGTYILEVITTGLSPRFTLTKDDKPVNAQAVGSISLSGEFIAGDRFSFSIVPTVVDNDVIPKIKEEVLTASITIENVPLSATKFGTVEKTRRVYLTNEEDTVGILSATIVPNVQVIGMQVTGGGLSQGSLSIGSFSIGTISIGTISIGTVNIGTVTTGSIIVEKPVFIYTVTDPVITYSSITLTASTEYEDNES